MGLFRRIGRGIRRAFGGGSDGGGAIVETVVVAVV
jgi:hypothetical protein